MDLELSLEVDGHAEPRGDHDVPATVQIRLVVLGIARGGENPPVRMQETPAAWVDGHIPKHLKSYKTSSFKLNRLQT